MKLSDRLAAAAHPDEINQPAAAPVEQAIAPAAQAIPRVEQAAAPAEPAATPAQPEPIGADRDTEPPTRNSS